MHNISLDDLLKYLYRETSPEQSIEIKKALETDTELREKYETLASSKKRLDALNFSPGQSTIDDILAYSRNHKNDKS